MKLSLGVASLVAALVLSAAPAGAQRVPAGAQRVPAGAQRGAKAPPPQLGDRAALLQQIHQQFMKQARNRMGLTPMQFPRFQRIVVDHAQRRAPLELEEDRLQVALREQVRLGRAGNQDSTAKLLEALKVTRTKLSTADAEQMHDLEAILTPVQRAQWQVMQERFRQQVRAAARQRPDSEPRTPQP